MVYYNIKLFIIIRRRWHMGFLSGLFGPGYKNKNPEIRKDCISGLLDKKILAELAEKDEDASVREAAQKRLEAISVKK
jgi:hypothetical protein